MADTLERMYGIILTRREDADIEKSYVAKMIAKGPKKIAQKVGEEAVETAIEAAAGRREGVIAESADLIFHLTLLWAALGIAPSDVAAELKAREGVSGLVEKKNRNEG